MRKLHPPIEPFDQFYLESEGHRLYVERCGNPEGYPLLFLHGGPGTGCNPNQRRFFDPKFFQVILFDQRGAGRSTPHASIDGNQTDKLVEDMEKLREKLGIEKWALFGGSWGSTLALAYAQSHPKTVSQMILRGIFLGRKQDIDWYIEGGASKLFPEAWELFLAPIKDSKASNNLEAYHTLLFSNDETEQLEAAKAWTRWEARCLELSTPVDTQEAFSEDRQALAIARTEAHYFKNGCFLKKPLLEQMEKIAQIPAIVIHGRYDCICPLDQAWELKKGWEMLGGEVDFRIIEEAGHAASDPKIEAALVEAVYDLQQRLDPITSQNRSPANSPG